MSARTPMRKARRNLGKDHAGSDRGAALVEFAVVLPLFLLLVFGIMEASWAFAHLNDAHHGVREGARIAAVDGDGDPLTTQDVLEEMCARMGLASDPNTTVELTIVQDNVDGFAARGATGNSSVSVTYQSLTGFLDFAFGAIIIKSDVNFLLEQPLGDENVTWAGTMVCP